MMTVRNKEVAFAGGFAAVVFTAVNLLWGGWCTAAWGCVIFLITWTLYARSRFRWHWTSAVLLCGVALVYAGAVANVWWYTDGAGTTGANPLLANWDANVDWTTARELAAGVPTTGKVRHYGVMMSWVMRITGVDVANAVMLNVLFYSLLLIVAGKLGYALNGSRRFAMWLIIAFLCMSYLAVQATVIIKDVSITLCMALFAWQMARWGARGNRLFDRQNVLWMVIALSGLAFLRPNLMFFFVVGAMVTWCFTDNRNASVGMTAAAVVALVLSFAMRHLYMTTVDPIDQIAVVSSEFFQFPESNSRPWDLVLGIYDTLSVWERLLWLPANVGVQFLIPLPWNYMSYVDHGITVPIAHMGFGWYYAGALSVYYVVRDLKWRRMSLCGAMALWGWACYVAVAYVSAGHVSRYALPLLPLILPSAVMAVAKWRRSRSLWIWLGIFTALLVAALVIGYRMYAALRGEQ